jgi:hypothetical protein
MRIDIVIIMIAFCCDAVKEMPRKYLEKNIKRKSITTAA